MKIKVTELKLAVVVILAGLLLVPSRSHAQMQMDMYNVTAIDGCSDFHCMKCSDWTACSTGNRCSLNHCGHEHAAVRCHWGILFYFRDAAGQNGIYARAEHVAEQLNKMMKMMENQRECYFTVWDEDKERIESDAQTPVIWFTMTEQEQMTKVLSVSRGDLWGYKYRADLPELKDKASPANELTRKLLARWWAANLKDHFTMMVLNKEPYRTTDTHCGRVLLKIWEEARTIIPPGEKIPMSTFTQVVKNLPSEEREHLYLAARIVPKNFDKD